MGNRVELNTDSHIMARIRVPESGSRNCNDGQKLLLIRAQKARWPRPLLPTSEPFSVKGFKRQLKPHQVYGAYQLLKWEPTTEIGGFLVDGICLGKTTPPLAVMVLLRLIGVACLGEGFSGRVGMGQKSITITPIKGKSVASPMESFPFHSAAPVSR
ncbi:unnamed protein product [Aspergillus oryzae var. brunneus]|nr:unnamed protein product [Aspergillus oryzae]GMG31067.1 unnamed protein product [Aspergillus oryzae]GMG42508.1 unnamed protein product [Aspergillus oryzae var. brunneus]